MSFLDWIFRRRRDQELEEEIQSHLMAARDRMECGESGDEGRHAVQREFGNALLVKELTREMWGRGWVERLRQDVRYALRQLRKNPGFAAVAIFTLALGIGANTAIFSVIENVLLHPLPYDHPQQLIEVSNTYLPAVLFAGLSPGDFQEWRTQATTVSAMGGFSWDESGANLTGDGSPARVKINYASANLFPMLGVKPADGRFFLSAEDRPSSAPIVILSYRFW